MFNFRRFNGTGELVSMTEVSTFVFVTIFLWTSNTLSISTVWLIDFLSWGAGIIVSKFTNSSIGTSACLKAPISKVVVVWLLNI